MIPLFGRYRQRLASLVAGLLCTVLFTFGIPSFWMPASAQTTGNGINVIIMIGDGMGWNMARTAAVAKGAPYYTSGKGSGLNFQKLIGYTYATTFGTTAKGTTTISNTGNSALCGSATATATNPVCTGFTFSPVFNPGTTLNGGGTGPGNLVGYDPSRGGPNPWTPLTPAAPGSYDKEYIKYSYPDSANTATTLYTGVKTYNNAISVDIYERDLTTILQTATAKGKSTGVVTSVPITHATPGAAQATVNRRAKYDANFPLLDNILQEAILKDEDGDTFLPTVLLGGGHPLDHENRTAVSPAFNYVYIQKSTYDELSTKPTSNRYGYRFLERGPNAAQTLLSTAAAIDPNAGNRLLGLYGARGQNGNIPTSSANGDYSNTGLDNFSLYSSTTETNQIPKPDTIRPLAPGETDAQFIAREVNENPTLADMTNAALSVLGKDKDGFWLMVEGGDIDWACHDNNLDNLIGTMNDFDKAVQSTIAWIGKNGGWSKNLLIVTADHDHYLTLNPDFPQLLAQYGAEDLTFNKHTPATAGHFWGSDPNKKYLWGNHSNRPVPVYYQGGTSTLASYIGKGFKSYGFDIPGLAGGVDQSHIYQTMYTAITGSLPPVNSAPVPTPGQTPAPIPLQTPPTVAPRPARR